MVRQRSAKPSFGSSNLPITSTSEQAPYGSEKPVAFGGWFFLRLYSAAPPFPTRPASLGSRGGPEAITRTAQKNQSPFGGWFFLRLDSAAPGFDLGRKAPAIAISASRLLEKSRQATFFAFFPVEKMLNFCIYRPCQGRKLTALTDPPFLVRIPFVS